MSEFLPDDWYENKECGRCNQLAPKRQVETYDGICGRCHYVLSQAAKEGRDTAPTLKTKKNGSKISDRIEEKYGKVTG
jgi:ribosomal protein S27AE